MTNNLGKTFYNFCKNKEEYLITHEFSVYMFMPPNDDLGDNVKFLHVILETGYMYDYHTKHICVLDIDFCDTLNHKFAGTTSDIIIENGDSVSFYNYVNQLDGDKVSHFVLSNPIGQIKSNAFYADDEIYESIKQFDVQELNGFLDDDDGS